MEEGGGGEYVGTRVCLLYCGAKLILVMPYLCHVNLFATNTCSATSYADHNNFLYTDSDLVFRVILVLYL